MNATQPQNLLIDLHSILFTDFLMKWSDGLRLGDPRTVRYSCGHVTQEAPSGKRWTALAYTLGGFARSLRPWLSAWWGDRDHWDPVASTGRRPARTPLRLWSETPEKTLLPNCDWLRKLENCSVSQSSNRWDHQLQLKLILIFGGSNPFLVIGLPYDMVLWAFKPHNKNNMSPIFWAEPNSESCTT